MGKKSFKTKFSPILSGTLLISGTMIGAGMLGMPLVTGISGFFPGAIMTSVVWLFMYITGLCFSEVILWNQDGSNLLTISSKFLGKYVSYCSGGMFIFLYYSLMVAYFAAGAPLLSSALEYLGVSLKGWKLFLIFGSIFSAILFIGPRFINRINMIMSVGMIFSWLALIVSGSDQVKGENLLSHHFPSMLSAVPVLFSAFGFHNLLPSLSTYLKRDRRAIHLSIFCGTILSFLVYLVWQWLVIGAIPKKILLETMQMGMPVTNAFESITGVTHFVIIGRFFAFFAITTSLLGVSFSMVDFLGDALSISDRRGLRRLFLTLLTLFPPFILCTFKPNIFNEALGVAGGFGEAFLNGLLPVALMLVGVAYWKFKSDLSFLKKRSVLFCFILFSVFVIFIEVKNILFGL